MIVSIEVVAPIPPRVLAAKSISASTFQSEERPASLGGNATHLLGRRSRFIGELLNYSNNGASISSPRSLSCINVLIATRAEETDIPAEDFALA